MTGDDGKGPNFQKIGEVRPSQMTHTYGVGSIVELPFLSVVVGSHARWKQVDRDGRDTMRTVAEPRLLEAVRYDLNHWVESLRTPPSLPSDNTRNPLKDRSNWVGVWGWPFPRWLRCGRCDELAEIDSNFFQWEMDPRRPHDASYVHEGCGGYNIRATPVRVVTVCTSGHMDEFPWIEFAHRNSGYACPQMTGNARPSLTLEDRGYAERATDLTLSCNTCDHGPVSLEVAFNPTTRNVMPDCRGFHPHLRQYDPGGCDRTAKAIMIGASNLWFPLRRSVLSIPGPLDEVEHFVAKHWDALKKLQEFEQLQKVADPEFWAPLPFVVATDLPLEDIWKVIEHTRDDTDEHEPDGPPDLLLPEWQMFTSTKTVESTHFKMRIAGPPQTTHHAAAFDDAKQLTRLREVVALTGFTRLDSLDTDEPGDATVQRAPLTWITHDGKSRPEWVPAAESLGEGILVLLGEATVATWEQQAVNHERLAGLRDAHRGWRENRNLDPNRNLPDARYVMLHSFSHALINELALDAGYNTASIRERIYSRPPDHPSGAMAGVLLFTAEPDAEGTLGGLVALGEPSRLGAAIDGALRRAQLCSGDPFCAEHTASADEKATHGAACHSCMFLPETSCEAANRYLDRSFIVPTMSCNDGLGYFTWTP